MWKKGADNVEKSKKCDGQIGVFYVKTECYNSGRIIENFKKQGGAVWDFQSEKGKTKFYCSGVSKFQIMKILAKCGGEKVEISCKSGVAKLKTKLWAVVGVAVFCSVIFISNLFVFSVSVQGEDDVLKVHVENIASEIFPLATLKTQANITALKSQLADCEEIAFFTVEIYQNNLQINFLKAENAVVIPKNENVVSPESGILISLSTLSGTPQKTAGDYVEKGEILIVAEVGKEEKTPTDTAMGSGVLQVSKTAEYTFSQISTDRTYTGESETVTYLKIGETEIFKPNSDFENYTTQTKETAFLSPNITVITETRLEYNECTNIYTTTDLEERAIAIFTLQNLQEFAHTITEISVQSNWDGQECKVSLKCEYLLQFAV
ncbi:MAG: sporulation protein YqfD [Bacillota bacterium]